MKQFVQVSTRPYGFGNWENLAIGNGILTVEDEAQAWERADAARKDKGGDAARAAVSLATLRKIRYLMQW